MFIDIIPFEKEAYKIIGQAKALGDGSVNDEDKTPQNDSDFKATESKKTPEKKTPIKVITIKPETSETPPEKIKKPRITAIIRYDDASDKKHREYGFLTSADNKNINSAPEYKKVFQRVYNALDISFIA